MSAINLPSLMRKHEFPWEEGQSVVSHVNGAGAHVGCEGLLAGRVPRDPLKHRACGMDVTVEVMTGDNDAAGF